MLSILFNRKIISISPEYNNKMKKELYRKLEQCLYLWDDSIKGIPMKIRNVKLTKKIIEIVDEQDYINIPIRYEAICYMPKVNDYTCITYIY